MHKIRVSKKGQLLYKFGMEILVASIIVLTFLGVAYSYGSGEAIVKLRTARDIALTIEEMYLIPNGINTFVRYPEDASKFDIVVKDGTVSVSAVGNDVTEAVYGFAASTNHPPLSVVIKKPKELYIGKISSRIIISDKKPDLKELRCPEIKARSEIRNILIDSGLDESEDIEKAKLSNYIASSLIYNLKKDFNAEHARNQDENDIANNPLALVKAEIDKKVENADAVIRIRIGENQDKSNNIKVYFSPDSAKKDEIKALGCIMLNNLVKDEALDKITGTAIIPEKNEPILNNDKISMVIEVGNYLNPDSLDMLKDANAIRAISSSVYETIKPQKDEETK
ncbi:hypothetical protein KY366_01235 [Candidatus Woesearchaeota archaeon]|nr:hypothetical protein [Candidatus Woesearchaeota archaeon]